jgi:EAL domain-containing protein (putative c-di-GMP-specific phosphodiesterase class I)
MNKTFLNMSGVPIYIELIMGTTAIYDQEPHQGFRHSLIAQSFAEVKKTRVCRYQVKMDEEYKQAIDIASTFHEDYKHGRLSYAFQKIYSSTSKKVVAIELLARWTKEDGSIISPDVFIPVLEQTDMINVLLQESIKQAIRVIKQMKGKITVSINWSVKNITTENVNYLICEIEKSGVNPSWLQIELTEDNLVNSNAIQLLHQLKNIGFKIAIDDFGVGFSSYQYLGILPLDIVKIDKGLIQALSSNVKIQDLVKSVVQFCTINQITVVAEGIENLETLSLCQEYGIEFIQGFYYHVPQLIECLTDTVE